MELRYCEGCGDVIQQAEEGGDIDIGARILCSRCRGGGAASTPATKKSPSSASSLELAADSDGLDLFSSGTIAMHRDEFDAASGIGKESTGKESGDDGPLQLVDSDPTTGVVLPPAAETGGERSARDFGADGGGDGRLGSEAPSKEARRIVFPCVHCRASLSIRPVGKDSRLTCPYCSQHVYVTKDGRFLKTPPSIVAKKGSSVLDQIRPGSVRLKKAPGEGQAASGIPRASEATSAIVEGMPSPPPSKTSGGGTPPRSNGRAENRSSAIRKPADELSSGMGGPSHRPTGDSFRVKSPERPGGGSAAIRKPGSVAVRKQGSTVIRKQGSVAVRQQGSVAVRKSGLGATDKAGSSRDLRSVLGNPAGAGAASRADGSSAAAVRGRRKSRFVQESAPPATPFARGLRKAVGGILLTATLTIPFYAVSVLHVKASGTEASRRQSGGAGSLSASRPLRSLELFRELGRIAEKGVGRWIQSRRPQPAENNPEAEPARRSSRRAKRTSGRAAASADARRPTETTSSNGCRRNAPRDVIFGARTRIRHGLTRPVRGGTVSASKNSRGRLAQLARAPARQAGGHWFESSNAHH